jgi:hypothetical protein
MINKATFELTTVDNNRKFVLVDPELVDNGTNGERIGNGVFRIFLIEKDEKYIGDLAIHQEHDDWVYNGYELSEDEQEQLADLIYSYRHD